MGRGPVHKTHARTHLHKLTYLWTMYTRTFAPHTHKHYVVMLFIHVHVHVLMFVCVCVCDDEKKNSLVNSPQQKYNMKIIFVKIKHEKQTIPFLPKHFSCEVFCQSIHSVRVFIPNDTYKICVTKIILI